jgi:hypothetical protein
MLPVTLISSRPIGELMLLATSNYQFLPQEPPLGQGVVSKNILGNPMEGYTIERLGKIPTG